MRERPAALEQRAIVTLLAFGIPSAIQPPAKLITPATSRGLVSSLTVQPKRLICSSSFEVFWAGAKSSLGRLFMLQTGVRRSYVPDLSSHNHALQRTTGNLVGLLNATRSVGAVALL